MKKEYSKYFWSLNKESLEEVESVFKDPSLPKFNMYMVTLLSRCQNPKELFRLINKHTFIKSWPKVKGYWQKVSPQPTFINWWQTIYERLLEEKGLVVKKTSGKVSSLLLKVGKTLKKARVEKGFSQKELALQTGVKQPDISKIEEGKKNITLLTLFTLCRVLGIKKIDLD